MDNEMYPILIGWTHRMKERCESEALIKTIKYLRIVDKIVRQNF